MIWLEDEPDYAAEAGAAARVKVLYILGMTRSGSTILDRMLGQCDGFFSLGEAYSIWELNVLRNQSCGCGAPFDQCDVWRRIFTAAFGDRACETAQEMQDTWLRYLRTRHIPRMFIPFSGRVREESIERYERNLQRLYQAIAAETGSRILIDSSKYPTYAHVLAETPGIELFVLHIVRDPRAVAYSWQRRKREPSGGDANEMMGRMTPLSSASLWSLWNAAGELAFGGRNIPYLRIRYEDFVTEPRAALEKIFALLREPFELPMGDGQSVRLGVNHTLAGNPNRFATGTQVLRIDDVWKRNMKAGHKHLVTSIAWPLMKRYGYDLTA